MVSDNIIDDIDNVKEDIEFVGDSILKVYRYLSPGWNCGMNNSACQKILKRV